MYGGKMQYTLENFNEDYIQYKQTACLNQNQVAKILGVSPSTLENWRKECYGPSFIKPSPGKGRILYPKHEIVKFLNNTEKTL